MLPSYKVYAVTVALPVDLTAVVTVVRFVLRFNIGLVALVMIGVALNAAVAIVGIVVVNSDDDVNSRQVENQHRLSRSKFCRRYKNAELTISIAT